uniref:Uncharacterized protein n=1 Tax=Arundo donax TaxID=35708 RepID=A0A0A9HJS6_ARUDO
MWNADARLVVRLLNSLFYSATKVKIINMVLYFTSFSILFLRNNNPYAIEMVLFGFCQISYF